MAAARWAGFAAGSPPRDRDGLAAVGFFYLTNLGVPFALATVAGAIGLLARGGARIAFLAAWMVALFVIPNVVQASVIAFDMNKLLPGDVAAAAILAAWLMRRWPVPAVAVVLLLSLPSPLLVGAWTAAGNLQMLSRDQLAAADWAATTPARSVFVTDGWLHSFTDPAGRLRVGTFGPTWRTSATTPTRGDEIVRSIYCGGDAARAVDLARGLGAAYIVDAGRPTPCPTPTDFAADARLRLAYENPSLRVWLVPAAGP